MHERAAQNAWHLEIHTTSVGLLVSIKDTLFGLLKVVHGEEMPKVEAYLEKLVLRDVRALYQVLKTSLSILLKKVYVLALFHRVRHRLDQG